MEYFPFFFDLRNRVVLLVGGGEVALRKAQLLTRAGAKLCVVAPHIIKALHDVINQHGGEVRKRQYQKSDLDNAILAVVATDDDALNAQIKSDATAKGVAVNVVDNTALCDFIFPSIVDRSPLVVAVSSGGSSPVLARRIRAKIEMLLPATIAKLATLCRRFRDAVQQTLPPAQRRYFWESALDGAAAETALSGNIAAAESLLADDLMRFADAHHKTNASQTNTGEVYLIGAGPGDADLLTFRAHRLLQKADVVVYDRLVSAAVLDLARRDAEQIYVGKSRNKHAMSQEDINQLLITQAKAGKRVARLKGGDPFVFGRGGEEMLALQSAKVPYHIAAGLTAALGCAAAAGVPLTHRGLARGVRFCTAYQRDMHDARYWQHLAADDGTLVLYMAGATLAAVAQNLMDNGRAANTPTLVICGGTLPEQKVFAGALGNIAAKVGDELFSPALIMIGEVCALYAQDSQHAISDSDLAVLSLTAKSLTSVPVAVASEVTAQVNHQTNNQADNLTQQNHQNNIGDSSINIKQTEKINAVA